MTIGKKLGLIAFIITEILIISIFICSFIFDDFIIDYIELLTRQTIIFSIVWSAKAAKNFAQKMSGGLKSE